MNTSEGSSRVRVVHRTEVPVAKGGERSFAAHDVLARFVPGGGSTMRWIAVPRNGTCAIDATAAPTLLLVLGGAGLLDGRPIASGDVVTIPIGASAQVEGSVDILAIDAPAEPPPTAAGLVAIAQARAAAAQRGPFSMLLEDGVLADPTRRARFFACLRVVSDAFQTILLTRQATVRDPRFEEPFRLHFLAELGHNALLGDRAVVTDPVLKATTTWFCRRMLVLDNLDKAVLVHLVLETAGAHFHARAKEVLSDGGAYFAAHAEADEEHMVVPAGLLDGHDVATYRRLYDLVETGWNVFDAMGARIAEIVRA